MMNTTMRQLLLLLFACLLTATAVLLITRSWDRKIAVVDAIKLFNSYKMKVELEAKAGEQLKYLGNQADSLKKELSVKQRIKTIPQQDLEALYQTCAQAQQTLEQAFQESNQAINEQVWGRLNPLVDQYGKQQGLRLIIGANGMGSVLYNDAFYDKTEDLIKFVNEHYEQGN